MDPSELQELSLLRERHNAIYHRLTLLWGSKEFRIYVLTLISDSRGGTRIGFSPDVAVELIWALQVHDLKFPELGGFADKELPFTSGRMERPSRADIEATPVWPVLLIKLAVVGGVIYWAFLNY